MTSHNKGKSHCVVAGAASAGRTANITERQNDSYLNNLKLASLGEITQSISVSESVKFDKQGNGNLHINSHE
jgi:hypothetical protein